MNQPVDNASMKLVERIVAGDQRALARAITLIENEHAQARALLSLLHGRTGRAHVCGITGPPGAGKSSLVQSLATALRKADRRVAIVAVDPSSPFTGGALLGDRIRMEDGLQDPGIFMRSLASRGKLGGLSAATEDIVTLLDAAGFNVVLVETVGAGQSEVEIMRLAQTTIVVSVPGLGDDLQAEKSGIFEIADIFVVNKSDRDGADRVANDLTKMIGLVHLGSPGFNHWEPAGDDQHGAAATHRARPHLAGRFGTAEPGTLSWCPPVVKTVASNGRGTSELADRITEHRRFLTESGRWQAKRWERAQDRVRQLVQSVACRHFFDVPLAAGALDGLLRAVTAGETDPYAAAEQLVGLGQPDHDPSA